MVINFKIKQIRSGTHPQINKDIPTNSKFKKTISLTQQKSDLI
ncbi:hypothetical protein [Mycoplasmopsis citelli]|nr:hypothetical protein [Mycoplasmopsis citelli]